MPSWWGKSSSKNVKKKSSKDNLIDTLHRFITPTEQKGNVRSGGSRRHGADTASVKGSLSQAESQSTSSSTQVSRCQSFADRPHAHPLPLPRVHSSMTCRRSGHGGSKPMLEKRGKAQLFLPLPTPNHVPVRLDTADISGGLATASVSSNCSIDSDDSELHSPVENDFENGSGRIMHDPSRYVPFQYDQNMKLAVIFDYVCFDLIVPHFLTSPRLFLFLLFCKILKCGT